MAKPKIQGNNQSPPDYELLEHDVLILPVVRLIGELGPKQLKSILHLLGFDTNKPITKDLLAEGEPVGYRSRVTGEVVYGVHYVYHGYERVDSNWLKYGQANAHKYLCAGGMQELLKLMKGE